MAVVLNLWQRMQNIVNVAEFFCAITKFNPLSPVELFFDIANLAYDRYELNKCRFRHVYWYLDVPLPNRAGGYYHFYSSERSALQSSLFTDPRYRKLGSAHPKSLKPLPNFRFKIPNLTPERLDFIKFIDRTHPKASEQANIKFVHKNGDPHHEIYFIQPITNMDYEEEIQKAIIGYNVTHNLPMATHGCPEVLPVYAGQSIPWQTFTTGVLGSRQQEPPKKHGAYSEGAVAEKNHSDFKKTGKSVMPDDLDELFKKIDQDIKENLIPEADDS